MARQPDPWRELTKDLEALRKRIRELEIRSPYAGTGMSPNGANGIEVDGDLIIDGAGTVGGTWMASEFDGDLATSDPGTTGWAFDDTRAILPELVLRPGSIANDSLTDPVVPGVANLTANNFSVGVPWQNVVSTSLTVPAGCTRLLLTSSVWLQLFNTKTTGGSDGNGGDYMYTRVTVGGVTGQHTSTGVSGNSGTATATSGLSVLLTGLTPGGSVSLAGQGSTDYVISTSTFNKAVLTATLSWLR